MARIIVERVAFVNAAFLFAVVPGVVSVGFYIGGNLPVCIQFYTVYIRLADVEVFTDGIRVVAVDGALVRRRGFTNSLFSNFVFELRIEDGAVER